jgi:hypothetical protein
MKANPFFNSYLDPIAKIWESARPELPTRQVKIAMALKKASTKKAKKLKN